MADLRISEQFRDQLVQFLSGSNMPFAPTMAAIQGLQSLEPIEPPEADESDPEPSK